MSEEPRQVAARSVSGSVYNLVSSGITLALGFARNGILLPRLLPQSDFGIVAFALIFLNLVSLVTDMGLQPALIHRQDRVKEAAATHFILSLGMAGVKVALVFLAALLLPHFYPDKPDLVPVLLGLTAVDLVRALNATPMALMIKELDFRRLATLDVVSSLVMTVVGPLLAWQGFGFWSLVGMEGAGVLLRTLALWFLIRPWRVWWKVDWPLVRWYFRFGLSLVAYSGLSYLVDSFDDFWAGNALGATALGLYSKAYEYAGYGRRAIANPIMDVFFPTYAKVQGDREALSKAFFRVNSLAARAGFLFAGAFALVAPEFVRIFPGPGWLPMVNTFRLMLVYIMLDPLLSTAGSLATAVGRPQILTRARAVQLAVFVPLVVGLSRFYVPALAMLNRALGLQVHGQAIDGIALAADVMLLVGLVLIMHGVRPYVDFSLRRMLAWPLLSLALSFSLTLFLASRISFSGDWPALLAKGAIFAILYSGILLLAERGDYIRNIQIVWNLLRRRPEGESRRSEVGDQTSEVGGQK